MDKQLDRAVQNLNLTYALQIKRKEIKSSKDLLNLSKQVEVKLHDIAKYEGPPPHIRKPYHKTRRTNAP